MTGIVTSLTGTEPMTGHEDIHGLGSRISLGMVVEFGVGCDEGGRGFMVGGFRITRMCTHGAHGVGVC